MSNVVSNVKVHRILFLRDNYVHIVISSRVTTGPNDWAVYGGRYFYCEHQKKQSGSYRLSIICVR